MTVNHHVGDAGNVVQAGVISGDVVFQQAENRDVELNLRHRDDEIELTCADEREPGDKETLELTVTNRVGPARELRFTVRGTPGLRWEIVRREGDSRVESISLEKGGEARLWLRVWCARTDPAAGPGYLEAGATVVGEDVARRWWFGNRLDVRVVANAVLGLRLELGSVTKAQRYQGRVRLENLGNTTLRGVLRSTKIPADDERLWLSPEYIGSAKSATPSRVPPLGHGETDLGGFVLLPGARSEVPIAVDVPSWAPGVRTWHLPLKVEVEREKPKAIGLPLTFRQQDAVADLRHWGGTELKVRQGVLAVAGAALVGVGVVLASLFHSATTESGFTYAQTMPCEAGSKVLVLESLTQADLDTQGHTVVDYDTFTLAQVTKSYPDLSRYQIQLSRRAALCQQVRDHAGPPEYQYFVWLGPVLDADTDKVCAELGREIIASCNPLPR
ncbi:hypothetical protein [Actinokineospora inagensis]|uniref:COG1470 family protein n=1 Tax=Actinokineospora inagensis TaxID=103730 RepID=UPI0004151A42|nr:hypothetical protein [Actinokineospora inagensis]